MTTAQAFLNTSHIKSIGIKEGRKSAYILKELESGRAVIPANKRRAGIDPIIIGRNFSCKINVNLGISGEASNLREEFLKLEAALENGADTVMDLSTGGGLDAIRKEIMARCKMPLGTVPVYGLFSELKDITKLTYRNMLNLIEKQAAQGVDFMTIHAGLMRKHLPLAEKRVTGIVSRGGSLIAGWMKAHAKENPFYERFDDILDICYEYNVTISLGDGLRPGSLADASDAAQFGELETLGELVLKARARGVQVMVEGPGHIPLNGIEMNVEKALKVCHDAPLYVLGPLVTDIALGFDHINAAIGAAIAARAGAAFLCCVTPGEHLGLPDLEEIKQGVTAFKLAAHAWDAARKLNGAQKRDLELSRARYAFDWEKQFSLALDPARARKMFRAKRGDTGKGYCSMCGENFCAMKNSKKTFGPGKAAI
ncbi:MAG TPA: thiamine biosynthesis protein ThiC [Elusimicrobia bacterium]|nr:thiamine biosynthesis protein ThiC [Elusimicrobiota bacterium]